jgi:SulP family sulfate permease
VLAAQLAVLSGAVLLACGLLRVGFLANFFSRPVMNGFTLGSAIVISLGQLRTLLGAAPPHVHGPSAALGLPRLGLAPSGAHWQELLKPALLIGFMSFLIAMSGAQALALKRAEKLHTNRELVGLGFANVGSALSGGFPVTGSLSRSAVNFAAGARTQLAGVITAALLAGALVLPTGWLALLPLPVLAATIIVAVLGLLDWSTLRTAWHYDRADALALLATAGGVLLLGVEAGVVLGLLLSLGTMIWRESRPHIAVLVRIPHTEHFRNVDRYSAETDPAVLLLRVDAGLFFGNIEAVSQRIEEELAAHGDARHLVLVLSAVNAIDSSALFWLLELNRVLARRDVRLHLAEVKGPVLDRLRASTLLSELSGRLFLSTANAWDALAPHGT